MWYPLNSGLGEGLDSAKQKIAFLLPGVEPRIPGRPTCGLVTMLSYPVHGVVLNPFCAFYFFYGYSLCCATNRKVAGSIPAGVIGIFH